MDNIYMVMRSCWGYDSWEEAIIPFTEKSAAQDCANRLNEINNCVEYSVSIFPIYSSLDSIATDLNSITETLGEKL